MFKLGCAFLLPKLAGIDARDKQFARLVATLASLANLHLGKHAQRQPLFAPFKPELQAPLFTPIRMDFEIPPLLSYMR